MIKGINQGGKYITVTGGSPGSNYINNYSGAQGVGNLRFNTTNQNLEIWDGSSWTTLNVSYATVELNHEATDLLDWVKAKRIEEQEIRELAKKSKAVQNALDAVKKAEEELKLISILTKDYNEETTS